MKDSNISLLKLITANSVVAFGIAVWAKDQTVLAGLIVLNSVLTIIYVYSWTGNFIREHDVEVKGGLKLLAGIFPPIGVPLALFIQLRFKHAVKGVFIMFIVGMITNTMLMAALANSGLT